MAKRGGIFLERKKEETKETEEDEEDEEEEEEEEEEETTTTTVVFVRSSVCLRFNNCYFELLVFRLLDPPSFFFRRERIQGRSVQQKRNDEERERKMWPFPLFSLRIVFFIPPFLSSHLAAALLWCLFWWRRRRCAFLHQKAQHKE